MRKRLNGKGVRLFVSTVLALEVFLLSDIAVVFFGGELNPFAGVGLLCALVIGFVLIFPRKGRLLATAMVCIPALITAVGLCCYVGWSIFCNDAGYKAADNGKYQIYGERKVMLIVPHQDDDVNILGGVLEEYSRYGSELIPVFITSGDYADLAQIRYEEALTVFSSMGVPEEQVVFLGYGNEWKEGGPHIYNAESGMVLESHSGRTETFGTEDHPAFRDGRKYTIDNLLMDLESVILEYRPDVIFCSDYDHHIDHKATSLMFDKVMGRILKKDPDYTPVVYKAYAYGTAWEAEPDYYGENVLSTQDLFEKPYSQKPAVYRWEDRIRFPVAGDTLSRSLMGSKAYDLLAFYDSQGAWGQASRVVNGDRVAWQRRTDSLCLMADIQTSSGCGEFLNDFMLVENDNLTDGSHMPYDGVWVPEIADGEKNVTVTLSKPADIAAISLYDHPSGDHNVLDAQIRFDDGTVVNTGPLNPYGAATPIQVDRRQVSSFSIDIVQSEGEQAGLSEIEAFETETAWVGAFIKLMDKEGNFLYDYLMPEDGAAELHLYVFGGLPDVADECYTVGTSWDKGTASLEEGMIRVSCPRGGEFVLNVTCPESGVSDSIYIRNPGTPQRQWTKFWQTAEEAVFNFRSSGDGKKLLIFSIPRKISYVVRHLA